MSTSLIRRLAAITVAAACLSAVAAGADAKPLALHLPGLTAAASVGDIVSLNPQPLPPKVGDTASRFDSVMLNPQPLPPKMNSPTLKLPVAH